MIIKENVQFGKDYNEKLTELRIDVEGLFCNGIP
jgi:hypothetical protein